jgi:hypothetical protein
MKKIQFLTILLTIFICTTLYAKPVKIDLKRHSNVDPDHYRLNSPSEFIMDHERQRCYVLSKENHCIFVINMSTQPPIFIQKIKLYSWYQPRYKGLTLDTENNYLYALDEGNLKMYRIDLNSCINDNSICYSAIDVEKSPSIATIVDHEKIYIAHAIGKLTVVNTSTDQTIHSFTLDRNFIPEQMIHTNNKLYISGVLLESITNSEGKLLIVDINPLSETYGGIIKMITIQKYSSDMIYDQDLSRIYISHGTQQGHISIIDVDSDALIKTLSILPKSTDSVSAKYPSAMAIQDGMVYIVNETDNSFTIMNPYTFDLITPETYNTEIADPIGIISIDNKDQLMVLFQTGYLSIFDIQKYYSLSINTTGQVTGKVISHPDRIDCGNKCEGIFLENESITLSALASESHLFSGWYNAPCSNQENCEFRITDNMEIDAVFKSKNNEVFKAIIFAGDGQIEDLSINSQYISGYAYKVLLQQKYEKKNIRLFIDEPGHDYDSNGKNDDVYASPSIDGIRNTIGNWADDATDLLLIMIGHGHDGYLSFSPCGNEGNLYASDLNQWLSTFQAKTRARLIVVYDACNSGSFISDLVYPDINPPKRIVITSAKVNEKAVALYKHGYHSFTVHFFGNVFTGENIYNAFQNAKSMMEACKQHPQLNTDNDSDANDIDDEIEPGFIRKGVTTPNTPPIIQQVNDPLTLHDTSIGTISASCISDQDGISNVYAVITSPYYYNTNVTDSMLHFSIIDLLDDNQDGSYTATYHNFIYNGKYEILVYAVDAMGLSSLPSTTTVEQKNGLIPQAEDVDIDSIVGPKDTILLLQALSGKITNIPEVFDVNKNQSIGIEDVIMILRKAGKINKKN